MITALLVIALVIMTVLFVKTKINLHVLTKRITENKYLLLDEQDIESLAEEVVNELFKK